MQAADYFKQATQKLLALYPLSEAEGLMYWVFEDVLLIKKAHLHLFSKALGSAEFDKLEQILTRLLKGEPLQYILGYAYFMDLVLAVNPDVLIPRPETEELVLWVQDWVKQNSIENLCIADICTGSGCIALSLQKAYPLANISGIDVSEEALKVLKENAKSLKLPVHSVQADILSPEGLQALTNLNAQIWVCNPPYIPLQEMAEMHPNVKQFEPHLALFVENEDPLIFYRNILKVFIAESETQVLFFEISENQGHAIQKLAAEFNCEIALRKDLQGKNRMAKITA